MDLHGQVCAITGGSVGIGRALAIALGEQGASVRVYPTDLRDLHAIAAAAEAILEDWGRVDLIANVAGVWRTRLGEREAVLNLTQRYQTLGGTLSLDGRELAIAEGRMAGDRINLTAGGLVLGGRVSGDAIEGRAGERADATASTWTSRRIR